MKLKNPVITDNSRSRDPFIVQYNGIYYSCYGGYSDKVVVTRFPTLDKIAEAEEKVVYKCDGSNAENWYAPEMHFLNGRWYIYGAPNEQGSDCHTMQILASKTDDPMSDYEYLGEIEGINGRWSIDGTLFYHKDKLYMAVAMGDLKICEMESPTKIKTEPRTLITADYEWERQMLPIVEGPAVLEKDGKLFMVYSASDCRCDGYCLGLLTFKGGDILNPDNWEKSPEPVFKSANGFFGPGHCSFTKYGDKDIIAYHANTVSGSGPTGSYLCLGVFDWIDGKPYFDAPQKEVEF